MKENLLTTNHSFTKNGRKRNKDYIFPGGKYKGRSIKRVPVRYLFNNIQHNSIYSTVSREELQRRGSHLPDIDVTSHAIDRVSLLCLDLWQKTKKNNEGIYSWVLRMARNAIDKGSYKNNRIIAYKSLIFAFDMSLTVPLLKTVMLNNRRIK